MPPKSIQVRVQRIYGGAGRVVVVDESHPTRDDWYSMDKMVVDIINPTVKCGEYLDVQTSDLSWIDYDWSR